MSHATTRQAVYTTVSGPPQNVVYAQLATLKTQLGVTVSTWDAYLTGLLEEASSRVQGAAGRQLYRAQYTDRFASTGSRRYVTQRFPVASIEEVTYDGAVQTLSDFVIEDREAGFIHHSNGSFYASTDPTMWTIKYTAGYFVPDDDLTDDIAVDGSAETFTSAASAFHPYLRAGDMIEASGFTTDDGFHVLAAATTGVLTTDGSDLTTESAVTDAVIKVANLPARYERATLDLAAATYARNAAALSGVSSVKLGDVTVGFHPQDVQKMTDGLLGSGW